MAGTSLFAPHPTIANLYVGLTDSTQDGNPIMYARCTGTPDTTANTYAHGCLMIQTDSGTGSEAIYENIGSYAAPSWQLIGSIAPSEISLTEGKMLRGSSTGTAEEQFYFAVAVKPSNGTTPVRLFGSPTTGFKGSLTGLEVVALDDANGTATFATSAGVVATIAKGSINSVKGSSVLSAQTATFVPTGSVTGTMDTTARVLYKAYFVTPSNPSIN